MKAKFLLPVVVGALLLGAAYALLKPPPSAAPSQRSAADVQPASPPPSSSQPHDPPPAQVSVLYARPNVFDIVVKGGKRVSEPAVLQAHQGDEVTLRITSDTTDELHLHGYNLQMQVSPERTAVLKFTASRTGRFTFEFHRIGLELGALEVYPR